MITIDFSCDRGHRFTGYFNDHAAFSDQTDRNMISCPLCDSPDVRRLYTGCSIQIRQSPTLREKAGGSALFNAIREFNRFVRENFDYVGGDFADTARAIYYGIDENRNCYGEATLREIDELAEEGIGILPLIDVDSIEN